MLKLPKEIEPKAIEHLKYFFISITIVVLAWVFLFRLNYILFSQFNKTELIDLIFLPSGIRLISIMLFEYYAVIGLFLGSLMTIMLMDIEHVIIISLISAFNPYIAFKTSNFLLNIKITLIGLTPSQLLLMTVIYALFNSLSHNFYFYFTGITKEFLDTTVEMFLGDLMGSLIVLYTFSLSIKLVRKLHQVTL